MRSSVLMSENLKRPDTHWGLIQNSSIKSNKTDVAIIAIIAIIHVKMQQTAQDFEMHKTSSDVYYVDGLVWLLPVVVLQSSRRPSVTGGIRTSTTHST